MKRLAAVGATIACLAAPALAEGSITPFRTPSSNIHCMLIEGDEGMLVDCEMREVAKFTLPLKRPADCELDWGSRFTLDAEGRPQLVCHGDTVQDPSSRVLDYGQSIGNEMLNCMSRQSGLTCENQSGHGFMLSKAKQRFY